MKPTHLDEPFLTPEEAAAFLGWKKATLYRKAWAREVKSYKIGSSLRFRKSDLMALVTEVKPLSA